MATTMDIDERVELELDLDESLNNLLDDTLSASSEVRKNSVHVTIYKNPKVPWEDKIVSTSLNYDLTVLELGAKEAAKCIHLDWLFS